jgi:cytochrome c oxidase subunit 2
MRSKLLVVLVAGSAAIALAGGVRAGAPAKKTFEVTAKRYAFEPEKIEVTQGDTVAITVKSADVAHGIEIKKFKINEFIPMDGEPVTVEFVASQAGTFEIACSEYCGNGHKRMKGTLVVLPAAK